LGTEYRGLKIIIIKLGCGKLGAFSSSSLDFISTLGHKISSVSSEKVETSFLLQRLSVALQRFNAVLLHDTFDPQDDPDQ